MYRLLKEQLIKWKNNTNRKPLILNGARQTGKTYLVRDFANEFYDDYIEVNFEKDNKLSNIFSDTLSPKTIIIKLENYFEKRITNKTLIFFDEIQACPPALTSLKYFCEEANDYDVIAAGSLLGLMIHRNYKTKHFSYPVGKVYSLQLYPMNFKEFLLALNENILIEEIYKCYKNKNKMHDIIHEKSLKLYRDYLTLGGMPEVINEYINTNSFVAASSLIDIIYKSYINDIPKYSSTIDSIKIKDIYNSISNQLIANNRNFKYSNVKVGKNSQYYNNSIDWLINSGIVLKSNLIKNITSPISSGVDGYSFRLFLSDVGLLRNKANIKISNIQDINYRDNYTGALVENYVACEFTSYNIPLYYWLGKSDAEIDFLVSDFKIPVIPIEVKAGKRVTSKSLNTFKNNNSCNYSIRISQKNFGFEKNIDSIPLYAVFCLAEELSNDSY